MKQTATAEIDPNALTRCPNVGEVLVVSPRRRYRVLEVRPVLELNGVAAVGTPAWWVVACRQKKDGVLIGKNHSTVYVQGATRLVGV